MKKDFNILKITRENILKSLGVLSKAQLTKTPPGFNNNILWNAGHCITSQQKLCYALSGLETKMPEHFPAFFGKGSSPELWSQTPEILEVKGLLLSSASGLEEDYDKGIFKDFTEYKTSYGFTLKNIKDAIA